ncbi:MAG: purine-nucleoside phosphorylase [Candidatus Dadabacteria bacterium]
MDTYEKLQAAGRHLLKYNFHAKVAVVLGSGLGDFVKEIKIEHEIDYKEIPYFPVSTVKGHQGKLILGNISGQPIIAMAGRFHYYEGYSPEEIIFPIRVMKYLGVQTVMLSNAAGAVDRNYKVGDLMIITDHISFMITNPLIGKNDDRLGTRFPDMSEPYNKELIARAKRIAEEKGITVREGVYIAVTGPTFETRAEYKLIEIMGGSAVGMSTVQEVIAARHAGMDVFAMSVITDLGIREEDNIITHEEVLEAARNAEPSFAAIFRELIVSMS